MGIKSVDDTKAEISVYDCNTPNTTQTLTLYKNSEGKYETWEYKTSGYGLFNNLDFGSGKKSACISYTTLFNEFANDFNNVLKENKKEIEEDYNHIISVLNNNISIVQNGIRNQLNNLRNQSQILPITSDSISTSGENQKEENGYLYWIKDDDELKFENGDEANQISIAGDYMIINTDIPKDAVLTLNAEEDKDNAYAYIENMQEDDSFTIEYVTLDDDINEDKITIDGTATDKIETTKNGETVEVIGAKTLEINVDMDGKNAEKVSVNAQNQPIKITPDSDGGVLVEKDTNNDGIFDQVVVDTKNENSSQVDSSSQTEDTSSEIETSSNIDSSSKVDDISSNADNSLQENTSSITDNSSSKADIQDTPLGDLSGDGAIDTTDALIILKQVVGLIELTPEQQKTADVDKNNTVDTNDALMILKKVVGLISF